MNTTEPKRDFKFNLHVSSGTGSITPGTPFLCHIGSIDCVYTLQPRRRGGSNEYPQSMFGAKIGKKNR